MRIDCIFFMHREVRIKNHWSSCHELFLNRAQKGFLLRTIGRCRSFTKALDHAPVTRFFLSPSLKRSLVNADTLTGLSSGTNSFPGLTSASCGTARVAKEDSCVYYYLESARSTAAFSASWLKKVYAKSINPFFFSCVFFTEKGGWVLPPAVSNTSGCGTLCAVYAEWVGRGRGAEGEKERGRGKEG